MNQTLKFPDINFWFGHDQISENTGLVLEDYILTPLRRPTTSEDDLPTDESEASFGEQLLLEASNSKFIAVES